MLSAPLFTFYINNIFKKLDSRGCQMLGLCVSSFMYADDLILLAPSLTELQYMINLFCKELNDIDLKLNDSKSCCIRIGKRWHVHNIEMKTCNGFLSWTQDITYLDVNIISGPKFACCNDRAKSNFYASFNSIYGKLGRINNPIVTFMSFICSGSTTTY